MKVEVTNLVKTFDRGFRAVDGLSFSFSSGEVIGFVGPNGAGKTTTMRIMSTLDTPDSGDITLDGVSVLDHPEQAHRLIGFMPDDLPSRTDTTVDEYLDFFARAYGLRGAAIRKAVEGVEEFTGLTEFRDRTLHALSKGMKQRVSLARALVHDPAVLIMDERKREGDLDFLAHRFRTGGDVYLYRDHRKGQASQRRSGGECGNLDQAALPAGRQRKGVAHPP